MLPSGKRFLQKDGYTDQAAGLLLMACFIGGFIGIQVVSRLLHQYMPSHVVDCDHSHEDTAVDSHSCSHGRKQSSRGNPDHERVRQHSSAHHHSHSHNHKHSHAGHKHSVTFANGHATESTPLLASEVDQNGQVPTQPKLDQVARSGGLTVDVPNANGAAIRTQTNDRRPSMLQVQKRVVSFVKDTKSNCDQQGPCYGYSDPCGQECFKHLSNRSTFSARHSTSLRTTTGPLYSQQASVFSGNGHHQNGDADSSPISPVSPKFRTSRVHSRDPAVENEHHHHDDTSCSSETDVEAQHHHHVPTNAFLSIGLQTSIAIALHKFPEGFITYATNHANPSLGFNVFMALFVHNISEGFAMALPLYMALGSRFKAMMWSALLGGLSQPFGAGIAVLWFKLANRTSFSPNEVAYACMFGITAGIMVSVALQLFVESLSLNHNRNLSIFFAFLGMATLGLSGAVFDSH
jgi:zinc transporter, ZIP family